MLQIREWDNLYENSRTRGLRQMLWIPVPDKLDGDGYTELVDHPSGAAHLGAWLAIIQIASKSTPRGILVRDNGEPHTPQTLSRISRLPAPIFEEVIPRLLKIEWLEHTRQESAEIPHRPAASTQGYAAFPHQGAASLRGTDEEGKEWKEGIEGTETRRAPACDNWSEPTPFESFQALYPEPKRLVHVERAARAYAGRIGEDTAEHDRLVEGLRRHIDSDQWQRTLRENGGKYIPAMDRFISDGLYLDSPAPYREELTAIDEAMSIYERSRREKEVA